eukprot:1574087-Rhodomonas_salina.1
MKRSGPIVPSMSVVGSGQASLSSSSVGHATCVPNRTLVTSRYCFDHVSALPRSCRTALPRSRWTSLQAPQYAMPRECSCSVGTYRYLRVKGLATTVQKYLQALEPCGHPPTSTARPSVPLFGGGGGRGRGGRGKEEEEDEEDQGEEEEEEEEEEDEGHVTVWC